jgi:NRPS condensation-like uncharacterized protein
MKKHFRAEPFDLWQYLGKTSFKPIIACRIDFAGTIDPDILTQAVTHSLNTIPHVGYCFDDSRNRPSWVAKGFTGKDMVQSVRAEGNSEEQIKRLILADVDYTRRPQLMITVLRRAGQDTLCAVISHMSVGNA